MQTARLQPQTDHTKHLNSEKISKGVYAFVPSKDRACITVPLLNLKNCSLFSLATC